MPYHYHRGMDQNSHLSAQRIMKQRRGRTARNTWERRLAAAKANPNQWLIYEVDDKTWNSAYRLANAHPHNLEAVRRTKNGQRFIFLRWNDHTSDLPLPAAPSAASEEPEHLPMFEPLALGVALRNEHYVLSREWVVRRVDNGRIVFSQQDDLTVSAAGSVFAWPA